MSDKQFDELEALILNSLAERDRISVTELANTLDSTSDDIEIPLARLKEKDKIATAGDDVILKMSAKDRKDFERLDRKFEKGQRESIAALREIRERKLFREDFGTFDDYMESCGRTRQWATQQINWLRAVELLEEHGKEPYHLSVDAAQPLTKLKDHPEELVRALLNAEETAQVSGKHDPTKKMLKDAVSNQERFLDRRQVLATPDLTYEESQALDRLCEGHRASQNLVELARSKSEASGEPLPECLRVTCEEERSLPRNMDLLEAARGEELAALIDSLATFAKELEKEDALKKKEQECKQTLASVQRELRREPKENESAEGGKEPDAAANDEEGEEEEPGEVFYVELTGDFQRWLKPHFYMGYGLFPSQGVAEILACLADEMETNGAVSTESSITVRPYTDDDSAEDVSTE